MIYIGTHPTHHTLLKPFASKFLFQSMFISGIYSPQTYVAYCSIDVEKKACKVSARSHNLNHFYTSSTDYEKCIYTVGKRNVSFIYLINGLDPMSHCSFFLPSKLSRQQGHNATERWIIIVKLLSHEYETLCLLHNLTRINISVSGPWSECLFKGGI